MRPGADPGVSGGRGGCQSGTPIQTISWHPSILEMRCCQRAKSPHFPPSSQSRRAYYSASKAPLADRAAKMPVPDELRTTRNGRGQGSGRWPPQIERRPSAFGASLLLHEPRIPLVSETEHTMARTVVVV